MVSMTSPAETTPTRRALAKQKTRERVLQAARALFAEKGFEGATIRDIAHHAGMSTGAVFASFSDKSELFEEVVLADVAAISAEMDREIARNDNIDDMLESLFRVPLNHNIAQLPILRSTLSLSWVRDDPGLAKAIRALQGLREKVGEAVNLAVSRGQLSQNADIPLIARLLWDVYLADLRRVVFFSNSPEEVAGRQRRHAEVILKGYRPPA